MEVNVEEDEEEDEKGVGQCRDGEKGRREVGVKGSEGKRKEGLSSDKMQIE